MTASDMQLVQEYATHQSESAFAELVSRHTNLVYSSALRQVRDQQLAEEITQVVFILLARKAASLGANTILTGWLYRTTGYVSGSALKRERRRQHREQEAYMQSEIDTPSTAVWNQLSPLLDDAMLRLGRSDRDALVLRYFEGRSLQEVGLTLGASEDAAKKRVSRALEKLRNFFAKHGVHSTTTAIAENISAHSIQAAPAALAKSVTAAALAKGAAASGSTLTLLKATLIAMKTKTIISAVAATVILAGITTWLAGFHFFHQPKAPPDFVAAGIKFPIQLPNGVFQRGSTKDPLFEIDVDPNTLRTSNSSPAIHIKGPLPPPPDLPPNFSDAAIQKDGESSLTAYAVTNGSPLLGQHIRVTGWLKSSKVQSWAGAYFYIWTKDHGFTRMDSMDDRDDRPILQGTMDWQQVDFVTDIPEEPCLICVGPDLYGPGELWGDDFQINLASADTPNTDDRHWRHTSAEPNTYFQTTDFQTTHKGRPAVCLTYAGTGAAPPGSWVWWGEKIRGSDVDKYLGHTVQWSGWVKTENVSNRLEPTIRPWIFNPSAGKSVVDARDRLDSGSNALKGTRDWTQFSVTCAVPDEAQHIDTAFIFYGSGKVWIDMDSLKFKIIK